jgi:RNA polymerase sigma-70 factor (ECF subfamily)
MIRHDLHTGFRGWCGILRSICADVDAFDPPDELPGATSLEIAEQKKQVERAINGLDELSRECVTLRYYENMSSKQIADLLGITPAAVDMRLSRARNQLKDRLQRFVGEV